MWKNQKCPISVCAVLLAAVFLFTACSSSSQDSGSIYSGSSAAVARDYMLAEGRTAAAPSTAPQVNMATGGEMMKEEGMMDVAAESPSNPPQNASIPALSERKIITTYNLHVETTEFDQSVEYIHSAVAEFGGYIESSSVQGKPLNNSAYNSRRANYTVRVPAGSIGGFIADLGDQYNVTNNDTYSDDITDSYYDSKARLASLEDQERQLNALLEKGGDLQYILEVHRELAEVRYQIESLYSTIQRMDKSVNFSTAHIFLQEVMVYQPVDPMPMSFAQRLSQTISNSWRDFSYSFQNGFVSFVYNLPFLLGGLIWLLIIAFALLLVRRMIRRRKGLQKGERTFGYRPQAFVYPPAHTASADAQAEEPGAKQNGDENNG